MKLVVQEKSPNEFEQIPVMGNITVGDIVHPYSIADIWPEEALNAIGIYLVDQAEPPEGKIMTGSHFERVNGHVTHTLDLVDKPVTEITRRQLLLGLLAHELINQEEALAAARTGEVPAAIASMFDTLEEPHKTAAYITWATMSVCERSHELVSMLAVSQDMGEEEVNQFFAMAASL